MSVRPRQNYAKRFQVIFMECCTIMEYCWEKLDLGVDPTENGGLAAILDFCYFDSHCIEKVVSLSRTRNWR